MDLTKLYNLTTPELRAEAERLGVNDTYALSRAQLVHAIRNQVGGPPPEGLLGRVLGFAKWALEATAAPTQETPSAEPEDDAAEIESSENGVEVPGRSEESETRHFTRPSDVPPSAAPPPTAPSGSPSSSRPPAGVFSGAHATFEEPFPTRTMARILADQGHYKRSLAIYANLLRDTPDDPELRGEADDVRSQSRARRPQLQ